MAITRQLFQLQELDIQIESTEQSLSSKNNQLGDRKTLDAAADNLNQEKQALEDLKRRHREAEAEVDDLLSKITATEEQLYGGKITNPKELSNLQHEVTTLKGHSDQAENKALEIIDLVEEAEGKVAAATGDYQKMETEWQQDQKKFAAEIKQLNATLADLTGQRTQLAAQIDSSALTLYDRIRQQKKPAVAKVEQGICRMCRISQSASALQRARSGQPVQCGTCGRILYIS